MRKVLANKTVGIWGKMRLSLRSREKAEKPKVWEQTA
jgi:hypothetical protein